MGDAAAGDRRAEVETDIKTFRLQRQAEELLADDDLFEQVRALSAVERLEVRDLAKGDSQQVPRVVRKTVQNQVAILRTVHDQRRAIIAERGQLREWPLHRRGI